MIWDIISDGFFFLLLSFMLSFGLHSQECPIQDFNFYFLILIIYIILPVICYFQFLHLHHDKVDIDTDTRLLLKPEKI